MNQGFNSFTIKIEIRNLYIKSSPSDLHVEIYFTLRFIEQYAIADLTVFLFIEKRYVIRFYK